MSIAIYYLGLLPAIREAARSCGYAIAVHGSMTRDFDLIAAPWVEVASGAEQLIEAITKAVHGHVVPRSDGGEWPREKPHFRKCWSIQLGAGAYLDVSVMPDDVEIGKADVFAAASTRIKQAQEDERQRCANIAWEMQMKSFGGGSAIGDAIQDSRNTGERS